MRRHFYKDDIAGPTWLYRVFVADVLAYVGVSSDPQARFATHRRRKPWWKSTTHVELQWHPSRADAFAAERAAIAAESPRYNISRPKGVLPHASN